jgi:hypothetical protein
LLEDALNLSGFELGDLFLGLSHLFLLLAFNLTEYLVELLV